MDASEQEVRDTSLKFAPVPAPGIMQKTAFACAVLFINNL